MNNIYKNILVAVPPITHEWYAQPADAIRKTAASLCRGKEVKLTFVGVFSMEQEIGTQEVSILPPEEMMGKVGAMEKEHHDRIREYVKWFADSGVPHKVMVESGDPAETIARIANDINADLIVMGHHHKSSIFDIFSTDVAARTIKSAPCDVTLVAAKRKL